MLSRNQLTKEQQIILLTGRCTFFKKDIEELNQLVVGDLNWSELFSLAIRHKMLGLFWNNLNKYCKGIKVNNIYRQVANMYYLGTKKRNEAFLEDYAKIQKECHKQGVYIFPTKGGYLIPNMYKDYGIRSVNDIDSLVRSEDVVKLRKILNGMGYIEGEYNRQTKEVKPVIRQKQIMWVQKLSNLFPFQKTSDSPYVEFFDYDFCFSFNKDTAPVTAIIDGTVANNLTHLKPAYFFMHLCYHLLREAKSAVAILFQIDLNIIKFCDIREFLVQKMSEDDCLEVIEFATKYNLLNALYFALFYLIEMYGDKKAVWMFDMIDIKDKDFLVKYGDIDFKETREWNKSFWTRLFAYSNKDEIKDIPEFEKNFYKYH